MSEINNKNGATEGEGSPEDIQPCSRENSPTSISIHRYGSGCELQEQESKPGSMTCVTCHSRNSSLHSITDFENSVVSMSDHEKGGGQKIILGSGRSKHMRMLAKKRKEINEVQKGITDQQSLYLHLFGQIRDLEAKCGIESTGQLGKMRFLILQGWPPHDLFLLLKDNSSPLKQKGFEGELCPAVLKHLKVELLSIPLEFSALASDLLARRSKLIDILRKRTVDSKPRNEYEKETVDLQKLVSEKSKSMGTKVNVILNLAETAWKDREDLLGRISQLNKEILHLENKIMQRSTQEIQKSTQEVKPVNIKPPQESTSITELKEQLNKERAARDSLKHMVETAESLLRKARLRITVLERELKTTKKQMQLSARKYQEYEVLHRCRETSYGVRSKKLLEHSKTGEETIEMLTLQRDALELRVKELQEQLKTVAAEYEAEETKTKTNLKRLQERIDEQVKLKTVAEARVLELEKRVKTVHEQHKLLFEKSDELMKISSERCVDFLPVKEVEPNQHETQIWRELQTTQRRLKEVTDELQKSRDDKDSLLNSLAKIAQEGSENNMGNELLKREQKIFQLQQDIEELKQENKSKSEKLAQKNRLIITLRMEASRTDYESCTSEPDQSIEIMELTEQVASLTRQREMLMTTAMSRTLMLERHERCAELFAKVTRARRDIVGLLEGRDCRERLHSDSDFPEVNLKDSLTPAAMKAAETFSELHADRERILQLQDVVALQNQQLQRERRVRNQLEQRRAILERLFLNRTTSTPYIPVHNVAAYLGSSSYLANDVFDKPA